MSPQPSRVKKGTRVWTCDQCGKTGLWGGAWHYLPGIISDANKCSDGGVLPVAFCSDACDDAWLAKAVKR